MAHAFMFKYGWRYSCWFIYLAIMLSFGMIPTCVPDFQKFFSELCSSVSQEVPDFDLLTVQEDFSNYTEDHNELLEGFLLAAGNPIFLSMLNKKDGEMQEILEQYPHVKAWQALGDHYLDEPKPINNWSALDWEAICVLLASDLCNLDS